MLFPDEHLQVEAQFFQLSILPEHRPQELLNVYVIVAVFLEHDHAEDLLVHILAHLRRDLGFLLFEPLVHRLNSVCDGAGLAVR